MRSRVGRRTSRLRVGVEAIDLVLDLSNTAEAPGVNLDGLGAVSSDVNLVIHLYITKKVKRLETEGQKTES